MDFGAPVEYLRAFEKDPSLAVLPLQTVADFRGVTRAAIDRMLRLEQLEEIRIGKTRYVRVSSLVALQREYDDRVSTVHKYLEKCAQKRTVVTYEPVMALIGLSPSIPADRNTIGSILGTISGRSREQDGILLTVIVHRKTQGKTRPGPGFFALAEALEIEWDDDDEFVEAETQKVWDHYADDDA